MNRFTIPALMAAVVAWLTPVAAQTYNDPSYNDRGYGYQQNRNDYSGRSNQRYGQQRYRGGYGQNNNRDDQRYNYGRSEEFDHDNRNDQSFGYQDRNHYINRPYYNDRYGLGRNGYGYGYMDRDNSEDDDD